MRKVMARVMAAAATAAVMAVPSSAAVVSGSVASGSVFAPARAAAVGPASGHHHGYNINGYNWGGYAAGGSGFTSVSATWKQPPVTCNSTKDLYAPWVGIDGYGSSTVEQTGVATDCASGSPVNEPWYEMYPQSPVYLNTGAYPVQSGDSIYASVVYVGGGEFTLTLQDVTRGWTYAVTKSLRSAQLTSAEVIIESPPGAYPDFGKISFSSAMVNGAPLGSFNPIALDPSYNGVYEARTGSLSGGTRFSIAYLHE